jgi:hypothetical protein
LTHGHEVKPPCKSDTKELKPPLNRTVSVTKEIMKRSKSENITLVYAYGCLPPVSQKLPFPYADMVKTDDFSHVEAEVEKQRAMWDALVAMDKQHIDSIDEYIIDQDPEYATAVKEYQEAQAKVSEIITKKRPEKGLNQKNIMDSVFTKNENPHSEPSDPADCDDVDEKPRQATTGDYGYTKIRNAARKRMWDLAKSWRREHKGVYKMFDAARKEKIKKIRQASGLYWGNYNAVLDNYDATRKRCMKQGRQARFSDWSRQDGCLTVQIQRTASGLGAAPSELFDGGCSQIQIGSVPEGVEKLPSGKRSRACRTVFEMRVDAEGNFIKCPVWMHRPIPEDARIKRVQLVWHKQGDRYKGQLCLTLIMPPKEIKRTSNKICSIDFGWEQEPDGSLKVATIRPLRGHPEKICLPPRWGTGIDQVERLNKYVHKDLIDIAAYIKADNQINSLLSETVARFNGTAGFKSVSAVKLYEAIEFLNFDVPDLVLGWAKRYEHLSVWRDNLRAKLIRRRREEYRLAARKIAMEYSVIDIGELILTEKAEDQQSKIRACISVLRAEIEHQARKHGAEVRVLREAKKVA